MITVTLFIPGQRVRFTYFELEREANAFIRSEILDRQPPDEDWTFIVDGEERRPTYADQGVHAVGCVCEACSVAYERDAWDPRMGAR